MYADAVFRTSLGWVHAQASHRGITRLQFSRRRPAVRSSAAAPDSVCHSERSEESHRSSETAPGKAQQHLRALQRDIRDYLAGKITRFTVAVDLRHVSPFHLAALRMAARIPFGRVMTYGDLAGCLGRPGAARAVGQAMARNPVPILIPCHRVVARSGLGGYGMGSHLKARLLRLEAKALAREGRPR